jgi:hypothetical protein
VAGKQNLLIEQGPAPISFETAGVRGNISVVGARADEMAAFLRSYLEPFSADSRAMAPAFEIHYAAATGPLAEPAHPWWNDPQMGYHVTSETDGSLTVLQRDFVASLTDGNTRAVATGPVLGPDSTDSIDNLLLLLYSLHLPRSGALALHAATVEREGQAYVFFGASGAGKSTLARHCHEVDGLRVLSGDQIYLKAGPGGLFAYPAPSTIPEFPRGHQGWCSQPRPVRAITHLLQRPGRFRYRALGVREILPLFLRETIYVPELRDGKPVLDSALASLRTGGVANGEMSYYKGQSFWTALDHYLSSGGNP